MDRILAETKGLKLFGRAPVDNRYTPSARGEGAWSRKSACWKGLLCTPELGSLVRRSGCVKKKACPLCCIRDGKMDVSDDADTGKTLWQFETRSGSNAQPIRSRTTDSNTLNSEKSRLEPSLYTRS